MSDPATTAAPGDASPGTPALRSLHALPTGVDHGADGDDVALARFMAEAGRILGATLDVEATLRQVASLAVPGIADWCAVDLLGPDGRLISLATAHQDPTKIALVEALRREYPPDPDDLIGPYDVVRRRRTMTVDVTPEMLREVAVDGRQADLLAQLQLRSWMCAPMLAGGQVLGTIAFAGAESGRSFGARHVEMAETLAVRAGAALANAKAYRTADRFRRILDSVAEGIFVIDLASGLIRDVNKGALDLLGAAPDAIVGRPLWSFTADLTPGDARRLVRPLLEDVLDARTIFTTVLPASGPPVPVEVLLQRLELPGEPAAIVAIARDIRERIEAQSRMERLAGSEHTRAAELNAVIRAIGDGVIVCGRDGRITLMNPAAETFLAPAGVVTTYQDVLDTLADRDGIAPALGQNAGPVVLATRSDPDRWMEIATYQVATSHNVRAQDHETIVVLRDVTAARRRDTLRETFIGVLSHELRTPVTTIYGGAKILARPDARLDPATRREIFDDIVAEAERLERLVEDVVAMNRFGEDGGELGHEPVLLQRIVPAAVAAEEVRWPGVRFGQVIAAGLPTVVADPIYVEQVLRNLLSNAAKYAGSSDAIHVIVEPAEDEVIVRILDDGPGIAPDEADRLFELFYRSPTTAGTTGGAGIGLFVCARLVRAMGGRIWARPRPEGGAEFGFALRIMGDD